MNRYDARAAEILEKAADLLETVGHVKGHSISYSGDAITGYCVTGAIVEQVTHWNVVMDWRARAKAYEVLADLISKDGREPTAKIIHWNDAPERTATEVIDLMKHAAKDLRNRQ
jgi:hypothetical protein